MGVEIERKFLIDKKILGSLKNGYQIKQGYIKTVDFTTVRVRIRDQEAFLTLKSKNKSTTRLEFEYPIPLKDAQEMLENLCQTSHVEKTRYLITHKSHTWEVDVFEGENKGLIVAEIELTSEDESFVLPKWVKEEVSDDARYYNSNLIEHPYTKWDA
ncbi:MAG: CYTH domain-containing protein [Sulfurovum sp.]|nr:CYTH domain-containing protein [Sulfurovum sp.]